MAINFLIALATALGSATLILLALRLFVKVFAPDAFTEMITIPAKTTERRVSEAIETPWQVLVDQAMASNLSHSVSEEAASRRLAMVRGLPLFMDLSPADLKEIASAAYEKQFRRREMIFLEGDPVRQVVLLTSGSAKIVQIGQSGTEFILGIRGPGEVVGTVGLRPQDRHASTAMALASSAALVWDAAVFERLSRRSVQLGRNITHILMQQLHEPEVRYDEISRERPSVRLSHQLVGLLNQLGRRVHGQLEIRPSREELAHLTGTTLLTVTRLLKEWKRRGIVSADREAVRVNDLSNLEKRLLESVTGPQETVPDAPLPPQADSYRASLAAADLGNEIEELKEALQAPN